MRQTEQSALTGYLDPYPPKAGPLIVTIYGDIVEPRGGTLWIGDLITLCGQFGVNESLVRTAVSRLVSRDQLRGDRVGRRSYYSLTDAAGSGFRTASAQIFAAPDTDCDLLIVVQPDRGEQDRLVADGFGQIADTVFLGSDRPGRSLSGTRLRAVPEEGGRYQLEGLLRQAFRLDALSTAYQEFLTRYGRLDTGALAGRDALAVRLAMVHAYRAIRLTDPRLPPSCLPEDWPGRAAQRLFAAAYLRLSESADAFIGENLTGLGVALPADSPAVNGRLETLRTE